MLVDVVLMRRGGRKQDVAAIRSTTPVRGQLRIWTDLWRESWLPNMPGTPTTFAHLRDQGEFDPAHPTLLPELRDAHVRSLADDSFVIVGLDRTNHTMGGEVDEPQAWWCRLVRQSLPGDD